MKRAIRVFPGGFVDHFLIFAREGFAKSHEKHEQATEFKFLRVASSMISSAKPSVSHATTR